MEYKETIDTYLSKIKQSNCLDYVSALPSEI